MTLLFTGNYMIPYHSLSYVRISRHETEEVSTPFKVEAVIVHANAQIEPLTIFVGNREDCFSHMEHLHQSFSEHLSRFPSRGYDELPNE